MSSARASSQPVVMSVAGAIRKRPRVRTLDRPRPRRPLHPVGLAGRRRARTSRRPVGRRAAAARKRRRPLLLGRAPPAPAGVSRHGREPGGRSAGRRRGLADGLRDLVVGRVERPAEHEHGALGRTEGLERGEHRDRHALGELDVVSDVRTRQQRFRQPFADVLLAPSRQRPQTVQGLTGDDADQVGAAGRAPRRDRHRPTAARSPGRRPRHRKRSRASRRRR